MAEAGPRTRWQGLYQDGQTARANPVSVTITADGLRLHLPDGRTLYWSYPDVRQTQGSHRGEHARLEHGPGPIAEALEVAEDGFLAAVRAVAPAARLRGPMPIAPYLGWLAGCVAATAAIVVGTYQWGIPWVAGAVAQHVPVAWEERFGEAVATELAPPKERLDDPALQSAVQRIVDRLAAARPSPYTYKVAIARNPEVNAFAAPGGYVVVYTGLLSKTKRPDELAGVLAHELQHVQHRHTTKALLRQASMQLLLSALTGDTGQVGQALGAAGTLGTLGYQRADEAEADRDGLRTMVAAGYEPDGMIDMFKTLQAEVQDDGRLARGLTFMSTHPNTGDRIRVLGKLADTLAPHPHADMAPAAWRKLVATAAKD